MDFTSPDLLNWLQFAKDDAIDALPFGVIAMDADGQTCVYSDYESRQSQLARNEVLNRRFFEQIAPCMNNLMVAGRFADARNSSAPLDAVIDYVIAFRAKVVQAKLRLLYSPGMSLHYLLIQRAPGTSA